MFDKLDEYEERLEEIDSILQDPDKVNRMENVGKIHQERGAIQEIVAEYREYQEMQTEMEEAEELLEDGDADPELKELAEMEYSELQEQCQKKKKKLEDMLLDMEDREVEESCIVEIRAGAGGEEASLFAADLFRMYRRFINDRGWDLEIMDATETDAGGYRNLTFSVEGEEAYLEMQFESGTHRVQRVPETESSGRIHTSTATVAVLPEPEEVDIELNEEDIEFSAMRASGPGGQNVNKVASKVRLVHTPTGMSVECQTEKSQHRNRKIAMRLLRTRLHQREKEKKQKERQEMRQNQIGTGERSEKIRTYNFPQNRVTDHRIELTTHNLEDFLEGELEEHLKELKEENRKKRLENLSSSD